MTIEMSFLTPIILFLIMNGILVSFYCHDKNILLGAAYETAVVGSNKIREVPPVTSEQLEQLFYERVGNKCVLFSGGNVQVTISTNEITVKVNAKKGRLRMSLEKRAAVTEPEKRIRDRNKIKEILDGAENNN